MIDDDVDDYNDTSNVDDDEGWAVTMRTLVSKSMRMPIMKRKITIMTMVTLTFTKTIETMKYR